jgi:hypothetical protein
MVKGTNITSKKSTHVFTDAKKIQSNQRSQHSPHRQTPSANNTGFFSLKSRTSWDIFTEFLTKRGEEAALSNSNMKGHRYWVSDMIAGAFSRDVGRYCCCK